MLLRCVRQCMTGFFVMQSMISPSLFPRYLSLLLIQSRHSRYVDLPVFLFLLSVLLIIRL
uniref:Uncharacterized protein n=1 Tax=Picea glauca TaxID=3330 RepID=A0A101LWS6_PICGL|nr:hypothetical protein ABT39_MTgene6239 [Picea glauca]QHR87314.1 hypothetical protein Q903MT_gene1324 [Picea sitchensis]